MRGRELRIQSSRLAAGLAKGEIDRGEFRVAKFCNNTKGHVFTIQSPEYKGSRARAESAIRDNSRIIHDSGIVYHSGVDVGEHFKLNAW